MGEERFPITLMDAGPGEFGIATWTQGEIGMCSASSPDPSPGRIRIPSITSVTTAAVRGL